MALTAFIRINGGNNGLTGKIAALTAFYRTSSVFNGVGQEEKAALTAFNQQNSGVNSVYPEK